MSKDTELNYAIVLEVVSTEPAKPLNSPVTFYLHDTFAQDVRTVRLRDGVARLTVWAYGAFTVGAIADDGRTPLELDLEECEHLPKDFRDA